MRVSVSYWESLAGGGGASTAERQAEQLRYEHGAGAGAIVDKRIKEALAAGRVEQAKDLRAVWLALRGR